MRRGQPWCCGPRFPLWFWRNVFLHINWADLGFCSYPYHSRNLMALGPNFYTKGLLKGLAFRVWVQMKRKRHEKYLAQA